MKNKMILALVLSSALLVSGAPLLAQADTVLTNGGGTCGIGSFRSCNTTLSDGSYFQFSPASVSFEDFQSANWEGYSLSILVIFASIVYKLKLFV